MKTIAAGGVAGERDLVGDHRALSCLPSARLRTTSSTSPTSSGSSAEVISSSSRIFGSMATARAMPTRCCWPPDSSDGQAVGLVSEADAGEPAFGDLPAPRALRLARAPCARPSMMFPAAVRCGKEVEALKHHSGFGAHARPDRARRGAGGAVRDRGSRLPCRRCGSSRRRRLSRKLTQRSSVVLPLPDGPMTVTTSPRCDLEVDCRAVPSSRRRTFDTSAISRSGCRTVRQLRPFFYSRMIGEARLQPPARQRERVVDGEIDERAEHVERHRLVGAADHLVDGLHQVGDAEQRHQRAALDRVGDAVDPGRQEAPEGLREDDVGEPLRGRSGRWPSPLPSGPWGSSRPRRARISITCAVLNKRQRQHRGPEGLRLSPTAGRP